jgi:hypothetical protein
VAMGWNTRSPMRDEWECRTCLRAFGREREVESAGNPLPRGVGDRILWVSGSTWRFYSSRSCFEDREERANAHFFAGREVRAAYLRASDFPVSRKSLTCEFDCPTTRHR